MVLRIGENSPAGNATALIYPNGKMNIVGVVNQEHARFSAQQFRLYIEETDGKEGRLAFSHFKIYNTVIASELGFRPNLSKLQRRYPMASEWRPELFPGLRLQVWLEKKSACKCVKRKNKPAESCKCNSTCLVFDSGKIIITGIHDHTKAAQVCDAVRLFFTDHQNLKNNNKELPRNMRWKDRNAQKLSELEVDFIGTYRGPTESAEKMLEKMPTKRIKAHGALAPIFEACDAGQLAMVEFTLKLDPSAAQLLDNEGRTPRQRVEAQKQLYLDEAVWKKLMQLLA
jgi:TATA-box binding protein (TBP) (component of TFIID and TFIIIB)